MRIVADTNVVVSAFLWGGPPGLLLNAARERRIAMATSPALIAELEEIIARPKFAPRLKEVGTSAPQLVGDYLALVDVVHPAATPRVITADPDDDHVLACALAAQADLIVSGDADLLTLGRYEGIPIITAAAALEAIEAAGRQAPR